MSPKHRFLSLLEITFFELFFHWQNRALMSSSVICENPSSEGYTNAGVAMLPNCGAPQQSEKLRVVNQRSNDHIRNLFSNRTWSPKKPEHWYTDMVYGTHSTSNCAKQEKRRCPWRSSCLFTSLALSFFFVQPTFSHELVDNVTARSSPRISPSPSG